MRGAWTVGWMLLGMGCGARHAAPEPLPVISLEINVEQALVAQSDLLLVGLSIGTDDPKGIIVDQVDASAVLHGSDLGNLSLVPMMEAHMPPWTLMLTWQIPAEADMTGVDSSIAGTVSWRSGSSPGRHSTFELQLDLPQADEPSEESQ